MNVIEEVIRDYKLNNLVTYSTDYDRYHTTHHIIHLKKDKVMTSPNQYAVAAFLKGFALGLENK